MSETLDRLAKINKLRAKQAQKKTRSEQADEMIADGYALIEEVAKIAIRQESSNYQSAAIQREGFAKIEPVVEQLQASTKNNDELITNVLDVFDTYTQAVKDLKTSTDEMKQKYHELKQSVDALELHVDAPNITVEPTKVDIDTEKHEPSDSEIGKNIEYHGFLKADGSFYILRINKGSTGRTYRFYAADKGYEKAWANRASVEYVRRNKARF